MTEYEKLLDEVHQLGITVLEVDVCTKKDFGLYLDNIIIINSNMTDTQKYCILAEELGHHFTIASDISDLTKTENIQKELKGRKIACEKLISPDTIINSILSGANNLYELSEDLGVTENFLLEAINHYKQKYGIYYVGKTHLLTFEPLNIINF